MPAIGRILAAAPLTTPDELRDNVVDVLRTAARRGVTKLHEAGTGALFGAGEIDIVHGLAQEGRLPTRLTLAIFDNAAKAFAATPIVPHAGDDMVRTTSWKIVADGSNQGRSGFQEQISSGIVLTGGTSLMKGMIELGEEVFHMPVRVGVPDYIGGFSERVRSPRYATSVGLLYAGRERQQTDQASRIQGAGFKGTLQRMKEWFQQTF